MRSLCKNRAGVMMIGMAVSVVVMAFSTNLLSAEIALHLDTSVPQVSFAADELVSVLQEKGHKVNRVDLDARTEGDAQMALVIVDGAEMLRKLNFADVKPVAEFDREGFSIRVGPNQYLVLGGDAAGVMYGGLELAEIIRVNGLDAVTDIDQSPYMAMRGTKFNCPLDARSPSYSDVCDAAQKNIPEMWSFDFWKTYIDNLARYRYNYISLWSLHPFPSLVKVPDYPDIALQDVHRSTVDWKEHYSLSGIGFDAPEILENVEIIKRMSITDKIEFWRKVMRYGRDRNVDFYVVTWNIFVNGTDGKYGITDDIHNQTTIDYFRKSVKQMFLTYPDLAGIGLTTGENMRAAGFEEKEEWAFNTYARGVLDAVKEQPGRKITFIHRQHMTGALDIAEKFAPLIEHENIEFIFSFKYAKAHVYSSTIQPYHPGFVKDIQSKGDLKTIWTLRNDDIYHFRWGAPDFVREFIQNIPYDVSLGYYYGSDQYIWGREFMSLEPETPRRIEIVKHWYQWMLWGRLGYNPELNNQRFVDIIQERFPAISGVDLFTAWQEASMVYPKTTGFHWGSLDFQWYIESSRSRSGPAQTPSGFHDVNRFITLSPHRGTDYLSIPDYVAAKSSGKILGGTDPIDLSDQIQAHADKALAIVAGMSHAGNKELRQILDDIRTIAFMGKYYAHKIRAATELAMFRATHTGDNQVTAISNLNQAAGAWRRYAAIALGQYSNPLWTNRVGYVDWRKTMEEVLYDITMVGGKPDLSSMKPTPGGVILEAENAETDIGEKAAKIGGYTGNGYLDFSDRVKGQYVEWKFEAPEAGTYLMEIRYILNRPAEFPAGVTLNGADAEEMVFWNSGGSSTWAWDRKPLQLRKGPNSIRLFPTGRLLIDHINLLKS